MPKTSKALLELLKNHNLQFTGDSYTDIKIGYSIWDGPFELVAEVIKIEELTTEE